MAVSYRYRPSLFHREVCYEVRDAALVGSNRRVVRFCDIDSIQVYDIDGSGLMESVRRCTIRPHRGRAMVLASVSFRGIGRFEDRSDAFQVFIETLIQQVAASNSRTRFIKGMPVGLWCFWAFAFASGAVAIPLTIGSLLVSLLGGNAILLSLVGIVVLMAIALLLLFFLRPLFRNWPRRFDPLANRSAP